MATYHYEIGATRWKKHNNQGDVRASKVNKGWSAMAEIRETHPISGNTLKSPQWWIRETYEGDEMTTPRYGYY